ncbi:hypothetical protein GCM10011391_27150 [Pullulanibacillus camelliae]|uniref:Endolytic transglycosylase MltG n=1 Tax=Pullulanibacillus camelliae TaxID=1707096 RepID=A0A8J3DWN2_9BACL|nr:endolytic transglycosylase MltG [Pullulanibacillus camelliae]GGE46862.1 hypothetical protein GCM10011391_27150 [Pullulanibacillus camelliae]
MTRNGMRAFAAGIIITCAVIAFFYYFIFNDAKGSSEKATNKSLTDSAVENYLNKKGQTAIDQATYDKWQAEDRQLQDGKKTSDDKKSSSDSAASDSDKKDDQSKAASDKKEESESKTVTIKVKSGMTSTDIADQLQSEKIIKDSQKLVDYIVGHDLEKYIQLGSYKIKSDMTIPQIAKVLSTYHR